MATVEVYYVGNDMAVDLRGLRDESTGAFMNAETVNADVKTKAGVSLGGVVPQAMAYQSPGTIGGDATGKTIVKSNTSGNNKLTVTVGLVAALSLSQNERIEIVGHSGWYKILEATSGAVSTDVDLYVDRILRKVRAGQIVRLVDGNYHGVIDATLAVEEGSEYDLEVSIVDDALWTTEIKVETRPPTA